MIIREELDICPGFGWQGGPEFRTRVVQLNSGAERRSQMNILARHRYTLPLNNVRNSEYLDRLKAAFMACRGQLHSFLAKDWSDCRAEEELFAVADGVDTQFQLLKNYQFGDAVYSRKISYINEIEITVNALPAAASVDLDAGLVVFAAPPSQGSILRWSGTFRVPVRFAQDYLPVSIDARAGSDDFAVNGSIELLEVDA